MLICKSVVKEGFFLSVGSPVAIQIIDSQSIEQYNFQYGNLFAATNSGI